RAEVDVQKEIPNMNMPILTQFGNSEQKTMSSRVIADLTEKRHDHVKRDVENMLGQLGLDIPKFGGIYFDAQNRQQTEYLLDEELTMTLVTGYNIVLRNRVIKRWRELESQVGLPSYAIDDPIERAKKWIEEEKQKQIAIQERDHAIATKAEIGGRREATAMGRLSAKVKEVESLKVQLDKSLDFASIKSVEIATGRKFGWHALKKWSKANSSEIKTIPDPNFGEVKTYHKDAWLAVYNINLSSIRGA
ncbi:MAG: Rha family transcriptional regulator, partial [Acinetobacter sp.]